MQEANVQAEEKAKAGGQAQLHEKCGGAHGQNNVGSHRLRSTRGAGQGAGSWWLGCPETAQGTTQSRKPKSRLKQKRCQNPGTAAGAVWWGGLTERGGTKGSTDDLRRKPKCQ